MFDELTQNIRENTLRSRETVRNVKAVLSNQVENAKRGVAGMVTLKGLFDLMGRRLNTLQGWLYKWTHKINEKLEVTNASLDLIAEGFVTESKVAENRYQVLRHELKNTGGKIDFLNNLVVPMKNQVDNLFNLLKGIASIQITLVFVLILLIGLAGSNGYIIWKLNQPPLNETHVVHD